MLYVDKEKFKRNLRNLMYEKDVKSIDVCNVLNIRPTTFSGWYSGRSLPSAPMLSKLADYFGLTTQELLGQELEERETTIYSADGTIHSGEEAKKMLKGAKVYTIEDDGSGAIDQLKFAVDCLEKGLITQEEFFKVKDIIFEEMRK